jgi:hypothetical protein
MEIRERTRSSGYVETGMQDKGVSEVAAVCGVDMTYRLTRSLRMRLLLAAMAC